MYVLCLQSKNVPLHFLLFKDYLQRENRRRASCQQTTHNDTDVCKIMCGERRLRNTSPLGHAPFDFVPSMDPF